MIFGTKDGTHELALVRQALMSPNSGLRPSVAFALFSPRTLRKQCKFTHVCLGDFTNEWVLKVSAFIHTGV